MKREERRQSIVDLLIESRGVDLNDLAERFAVSKMTIHRDLDDLEQAGLLRKVRGGATIEAGTQFESDFRIRETQDADAKARMSRAALQFVEPGMTVMVNDGSMAAVFGAALSEKRPVTIVTNNAAILDRMKGEPGITIIAIGGTFNAKFNAYLGLVTERSLAQLRADVAFISAPAVSSLKAFHMDDSVVRAKRAMMAAATCSYMFVNHQRFDRTALHVLADLSEFDALIVDEQPPEGNRQSIEKAGVTIIVAGS